MGAITPENAIFALGWFFALILGGLYKSKIDSDYVREAQFRKETEDLHEKADDLHSKLIDLQAERLRDAKEAADSREDIYEKSNDNLTRLTQNVIDAIEKLGKK